MKKLTLFCLFFSLTALAGEVTISSVQRISFESTYDDPGPADDLYAALSKVAPYNHEEVYGGEFLDEQFSGNAMWGHGGGHFQVNFDIASWSRTTVDQSKSDELTIAGDLAGALFSRLEKRGTWAAEVTETSKTLSAKYSACTASKPATAKFYDAWSCTFKSPKKDESDLSVR